MSQSFCPFALTVLIFFPVTQLKYWIFLLWILLNETLQQWLPTAWTTSSSLAQTQMWRTTQQTRYVTDFLLLGDDRYSWRVWQCREENHTGGKKPALKKHLPSGWLRKEALPSLAPEPGFHSPSNSSYHSCQHRNSVRTEHVWTELEEGETPKQKHCSLHYWPSTVRGPWVTTDVCFWEESGFTFIQSFQSSQLPDCKQASLMMVVLNCL